MWPIIGKSTAAILVLLGAVASEFMQRYGVVIDASMIQNVVETDAREVAELIIPTAVMRFVAFAVAPIALIVWWPIRWATPARELAYRGVGVLAAAAVAASAVAVYYRISRARRAITANCV